MNLEELFKNLSYGPASNLSLLGEGCGVIPESSYPRLLSLLNTSLSNLHSRYRLSQKTLTLEALEGVYIYYLRLEHALYSGISGTKYIIDTEEDPFLDDIIRIELVSTPDGFDFNINDRTSNCSTVFIPSYDSVQLVEPVAGDQYIVEYRANHAKFALTETDLTLEVRVPSPYQDALMANMVGQLYQSMNGQENTAKGQEYLARYERLCSELDMKNMDVASQTSTNDRPRIHGWP